MKNDTPLHAIRLKCLECSCGSANEVKECVIPDCALYPYRLGHDPKLKGKGQNKEQMAKVRAKSSLN